MDPSQVALLPVTFIEERNGKALVRLPNGSKTSVQFDALDVQPLWANFVASRFRPGVTAYCGDCQQPVGSIDWPQALVRLREHYGQAHPEASERWYYPTSAVVMVPGIGTYRVVAFRLTQCVGYSPSSSSSRPRRLHRT